MHFVQKVKKRYPYSHIPRIPRIPLVDHSLFVCRYFLRMSFNQFTHRYNIIVNDLNTFENCFAAEMSYSVGGYYLRVFLHRFSRQLFCELGLLQWVPLDTRLPILSNLEIFHWKWMYYYIRHSCPCGLFEFSIKIVMRSLLWIIIWLLILAK